MLADTSSDDGPSNGPSGLSLFLSVISTTAIATLATLAVLEFRRERRGRLVPLGERCEGLKRRRKRR